MKIFILTLLILITFCECYFIRFSRQVDNNDFSSVSAKQQLQPATLNSVPDNLQVGGFSNEGRPGFSNLIPQQQNNLLLQQQQSNLLQQQQQQPQNVLPHEQNNLQQQQQLVENQHSTNPTQQQLGNYSSNQESQQQQLLQPKQQQNEQLLNQTSIAITETPLIAKSTTTQLPVDKNVDLDGDGALSLAEVQYAAFVHHGLSSSVVENLFNQVDQNKDGYLNAAEFNKIRPLVLSKAENAAQRYLQNVDTDHNGLLSLSEAQAYILKEYGISNRDVERIWRLVAPSSGDEMDAVLFSKLRRRIRGMSIRLARHVMKVADKNEDGHINLKEAQMIAFEQEGIGAGEVIEMLASVDDNNDGELNAPEFADFQRIVRARAVETSKKALKVVDIDGSGTLTMDEAKQIAFDHYGFDEQTLEPFFAQADENEDNQLDAVEFAGFRSVIRSRAIKNALLSLSEMDEDGDGLINLAEAEKKARQDDDMDAKEVQTLFNVADQDKSRFLDKVELADFVRLVRLSAIRFVSDHFREYDINRDKIVTIDELENIIKDRYHVDFATTRRFFDKVDVDHSGDLIPGEIVDFRHEIRRHVADRNVQAELEMQNRREMEEIESKLRSEIEGKTKIEKHESGEEEVVDDVETNEKPAIDLMENNNKTGELEMNNSTMQTHRLSATTAQEEELNDEEELNTGESSSDDTTTILTTQSFTSTTTQPTTLKKRRKQKNKNTTELMPENITTEQKKIISNEQQQTIKPVENFKLENESSSTTISSIPKLKRRKKLRKQSTIAAEQVSTLTTKEPSTTSTTSTTTTTTTTTTTPSTTTFTTTTSKTSPLNVEYEECKEGDTDCEEVVENT